MRLRTGREKVEAAPDITGAINLRHRVRLSRKEKKPCVNFPLIQTKSPSGSPAELPHVPCPPGCASFGSHRAVVGRRHSATAGGFNECINLALNWVQRVFKSQKINVSFPNFSCPF